MSHNTHHTCPIFTPALLSSASPDSINQSTNWEANFNLKDKNDCAVYNYVQGVTVFALYKQPNTKGCWHQTISIAMNPIMFLMKTMTHIIQNVHYKEACITEEETWSQLS